MQSSRLLCHWPSFVLLILPGVFGCVNGSPSQQVPPNNDTVKIDLILGACVTHQGQYLVYTPTARDFWVVPVATGTQQQFPLHLHLFALGPVPGSENFWVAGKDKFWEPKKNTKNFMILSMINPRTGKRESENRIPTPAGLVCLGPTKFVLWETQEATGLGKAYLCEFSSGSMKKRDLSSLPGLKNGRIWFIYLVTDRYLVVAFNPARKVSPLGSGTPKPQETPLPDPDRGSGYQGTELLVFDLQTEKITATSKTGMGSEMGNAGIGYKQKYLAIGYNNLIELWKIPFLQRCQTLQLNPSQWTGRIAVSDDGRYIAFEHDQLEVWDASTKQMIRLDPTEPGSEKKTRPKVDPHKHPLLACLLRHPSALFTLAFVGSSHRLVSLTYDGCFTLWNLPERRIIRQFNVLK